jgi:hypothetical protein
VQTRLKRWIFKGDKNSHLAFLRMGNKSVGPMSQDFTACKKSVRSMNKNTSKTNLIISFRQVPSGFILHVCTDGTARELWWKNQDPSRVGIIPPGFSMLMYNLRDEEYARLWPQFRDVISFCRHDHYQLS